MDSRERENSDLANQSVAVGMKKCSHIPIIIILTFLFVGCGVFGGVELWQNIALREENAKLKLELSEDPSINPKTPDDEVIEYEYYDDSIPGAMYRIKFNYATNELYVYEHNFCSAVDCDGTERENTIILADYEKTKILHVIYKEDYDKGALSSALSCLVRDTEVMAREGDASWDYYKEYDPNRDGVVTYREFGNVFLSELAIELVNDDAS